nr:hypothetical protein [Methylomonas lenta]
MALIERVSKPLVVILDNASIHTAKKNETLLGFIGRKRYAILLLATLQPRAEPD